MTTRDYKAPTIKKLKDSYKLLRKNLNESCLQYTVHVYIEDAKIPTDFASKWSGRYREIIVKTNSAGSICFDLEGKKISASNLKKIIG